MMVSTAKKITKRKEPCRSYLAHEAYGCSESDRYGAFGVVIPLSPAVEERLADLETMVKHLRQENARLRGGSR